MHWVEPDADGSFTVAGMMKHLRDRMDLVVISHVMFMNGQVVHGLPQLADACHSAGAKLLVDSYHAAGVLPVDIAAMRADFAIGGSYKYLRGGPGACFLYLSPEILASGLRPLDTGWFARESIFGYERSEVPLLRAGGDAFLESTPPVLTYYQARSGQQFMLAMGVDRLGDYQRKQLNQLKRYLADAGIDAMGGDADHGAFLTVRHVSAGHLAKKIAESNVIADARGEWLRLCPDCLTREEELQTAVSVLRQALEQVHC
jgi:kynureninase